MISLSATSYDPSGAIIIHTRFENEYQAERRGSITATLDGGVAVYDTGYSISDKTLTARVKNPTKAMLDTLTYLVAYYGQVILSYSQGVFLAVLSFALNIDTLTINCRLISRLDG